VSSSLILNIAKSGLSAQQAVISNTANNIANVNTEGYSRRRVVLEARDSQSVLLSLGQGVEATNVQRLADKFLERVSRDAASAKESSKISADILGRAEGVFDITGDVPTIGSALEKFFGAIGDLTINPSNTELRANVLEQGNFLSTTINRAYNELAALQTEADERIGQEVLVANNLTKEIADLNLRIRTIEVGGVEAATERDAREIALKKLSEIVEVNVVEDNSSQINVSLANGFSLVNGNTARTIETTKTPSFVTGTVPPSLSGGPMNHIVFDYDTTAGSEHIDLTSLISQGGGRLAGLLQVRGVHDVATNTSPFQAKGDLVDLAARVESIARSLLTEFNQVYLGVDASNLASVSGNPLANDEDPLATPTTYSPTSGYYDPATGTSVQASLFGFFDFANAADSATGSISGLPDATDLADVEGTLYSFAQRIKVGITKGSEIATGRDLDLTEGTVKILPGDSSNLEELMKLRTHNFNTTVGSYNLNGTLSDGYRDAVTEVSNRVRTAQDETALAESTYISTEAQRLEFSGVSLDEEFSDLIRFQKAFQASARMIRIADEMLQTVIELI
jgi:flagellar hook-associated protein 1